jgi:hypothetical protein
VLQNLLGIANLLADYQKGLGTFPLVSTAQFPQNLSSFIKARGGAIMVCSVPAMVDIRIFYS